MSPDSAIAGIELIGDLQRCESGLLHSLRAADFLSFLVSAIQNQGLSEVDRASHDFDKGFTAIVALAESHVAVHTWPDEGYVSVNVHVCNYSRDNTPAAERLYEELCSYFKAGRAETHRIIRRMQ